MEKEKRNIKLRLGNKEFSLSFILSILSSIVGIIFSFLAAKYLESYTYGEVQYYISIVTLLSVFMIFGTDNFAIKNMQFADDKKKQATKSYLFSFVVSAAVLPIYAVIGYFLLARLNKDIRIIFLIYLTALALTLTNLAASFLQSLNKYDLRVLFSSFLPHISFLITFFIHFSTNTLDLFVRLYIYYYLIFYGLFGIPVLIVLFRPKNVRMSKTEVISILFMGLTWVLYNTTSPISNILIGERYEDFGLVGIFSVSNKLLSISAIATGVISNISYTVYAKLVKENEKEKLYNFYQSFVRITIYIAVPFYAAFIVEANNLMLFFGESYTGHNLILILLTISSLIECITGPCGSVLLMGGKEKENFIASVIRFATFIGGIAALINFTVYAAPIALIMSSVASNTAKLIFLRKFQGRTFLSAKTLLVLLIVAAISSACFFGLSFITNKYLWLGMNAVVGGGLIIGFILLTPFKEDKNFFRKGKENI